MPILAPPPSPFSLSPSASRPPSLAGPQAPALRGLTGRRLLAETGTVPHTSSITGLEGGAAVKYIREPKTMMAFDMARLARVDENEFELSYARELAKAAMNIPIELPETEMEACHAELSFALDKADHEPAFVKRLMSEVKAAKANLDRLSRMPVSAEVYPHPTPGDELARAAYYLTLFERSPDQFYWVVERDRNATAASVRLTDLEDFSVRFGPRFENAVELPGTPWVRMSGRRYPAAWLSAARAIVEVGGLARIREALGDFERGPALELRRRVQKRLVKL